MPKNPQVTEEALDSKQAHGHQNDKNTKTKTDVKKIKTLEDAFDLSREKARITFNNMTEQEKFEELEFKILFSELHRAEEYLMNLELAAKEIINPVFLNQGRLDTLNAQINEALDLESSAKTPFHEAKEALQTLDMLIDNSGLTEKQKLRKKEAVKFELHETFDRQINLLNKLKLQVENPFNPAFYSPPSIRKEKSEALVSSSKDISVQPDKAPEKNEPVSFFRKMKAEFKNELGKLTGEESEQEDLSEKSSNKPS